MDLMMAAIASPRGLPLYTRNSKDLVGLADVLQIIEV
jgi:predicted nucleic acid-binding protein